MLSSAVQNAIDKKDQAYARQLASVMERHSLHLRAMFGGTSLLDVTNRTKKPVPKPTNIKPTRMKREKKPPMELPPPPKHIQCVRCAKLYLEEFYVAKGWDKCQKCGGDLMPFDGDQKKATQNATYEAS